MYDTRMSQGRNPAGAIQQAMARNNAMRRASAGGQPGMQGQPALQSPFLNRQRIGPVASRLGAGGAALMQGAPTRTMAMQGAPMQGMPMQGTPQGSMNATRAQPMLQQAMTDPRVQAILQALQSRNTAQQGYPRYAGQAAPQSAQFAQNAMRQRATGPLSRYLGRG